MRHVEEAISPNYREVFQPFVSAVRVASVGSTPSRILPRWWGFSRKVLTMKALDLTFLESVSSATLAAWLDASNRETVRLQRELDATRAAKSALLGEITRRNRVSVSLPPKHTLAIDSTQTCKNCVRLGRASGHTSVKK